MALAVRQRGIGLMLIRLKRTSGMEAATTILPRSASFRVMLCSRTRCT